MNFDKEYISILAKKSLSPFLLTIILFVQIYTNINLSKRLEKLENVYFNIEQKIWNLQIVLWVDNLPITSVAPVNIWKGLLNPAESPKAMLPMKPDNVIDYVYLEKWTKEQDNTYPIGKKIIYAVQDDFFSAWSLYSKKLLKMWRQVSNIKESKVSKWDKMAVISFNATNWMNSIAVEFFNEIENYNKKAWAFVKIVINQ